MFILHQQKHIVGERREGGKTSAKAGDQKYVHIGGNQVSFFSHSKENTY